MHCCIKPESNPSYLQHQALFVYFLPDQKRQRTVLSPDQIRIEPMIVAAVLDLQSGFPLLVYRRYSARQSLEPNPAQDPCCTKHQPMNVRATLSPVSGFSTLLAFSSVQFGPLTSQAIGQVVGGNNGRFLRLSSLYLFPVVYFSAFTFILIAQLFILSAFTLKTQASVSVIQTNKLLTSYVLWIHFPRCVLSAVIVHFVGFNPCCLLVYFGGLHPQVFIPCYEFIHLSPQYL